MKTLILTFLLATAAVPQTPTAAPPRFYRLDFTVKEVEATKVVSSREYTAMIDPGNRLDIQFGDRVPVANAGKEGFTYLDVGFNLEATLVSIEENGLVLRVGANLTTVGAKTDVGPVLRTARWNARVLVPLKKPTALFSSDAPSDRKQLQLEVTATPIL